MKTVRIKNAAAAELAKLKWAKSSPAERERVARMGKAGGRARAKKLTAKQRNEIAKKAAVTRWGQTQK